MPNKRSNEVVCEKKKQLFIIQTFLILLIHLTFEFCVQIHFVYQIHTFNTYFSTTQYPFSILYLHTQIQIDIVYRKPGFYASFKISNVHCTMYIDKQSFDLFRKNDEYAF